MQLEPPGDLPRPHRTPPSPPGRSAEVKRPATRAGPPSSSAPGPPNRSAPPRRSRSHRNHDASPSRPRDPASGAILRRAAARGPGGAEVTQRGPARCIARCWCGLHFVRSCDRRSEDSGPWSCAIAHRAGLTGVRRTQPAPGCFRFRPHRGALGCLNCPGGQDGGPGRMRSCTIDTTRSTAATPTSP
jgi:hypothetical protein